MPITIFHLGPGLLCKAIAPRYFSWTLFALVNVMIDLEPVLNYLMTGDPAHRYLHTYLGATCIAVLAVIVGKRHCEQFLGWWNNHLNARQARWLATERSIGIAAAWSGALLGAWSHVFVDAFMHYEMKPFWPWSEANGSHGLVDIDLLHWLCIGAGLLGSAVMLLRHRGLCRYQNLLRSFLLAVSLPLLGATISEWGVVASHGSLLASVIQVPLFFLGVCALVVLPLALLWLLFSSKKRRASQSVVVLIGYLIGLMVGVFMGHEVRLAYLDAATLRATPIIVAINRYEQETGRLPAQLSDLVPRFLAFIPGTGMAANPEFRFRVPSASAWEWQDSRWVLVLPASRNLLNWDQVIYVPNHQKQAGIGLPSSGHWEHISE